MIAGLAKQWRDASPGAKLATALLAAFGALVLLGILALVLYVGAYFVAFGTKANLHTKPVPSPSGKYQVSATVNTTQRDKPDYLLVTIHLHDATGGMIDVAATRASHTQRWALGWMEDRDEVVLYSSDIGAQSYIVTSDTLVRADYPAASAQWQEVVRRGEELRGE